MKTLDKQDLANVAGGASKSDTLTSTLTAVQSSIKDLASQNNNSNNSGNNLMMPMMMMAMMNRPGPTVVTAGAPAAASPIVNISTRVRRW